MVDYADWLLYPRSTEREIVDSIAYLSRQVQEAEGGSIVIHSAWWIALARKGCILGRTRGSKPESGLLHRIAIFIEAFFVIFTTRASAKCSGAGRTVCAC